MYEKLNCQINNRPYYLGKTTIWHIQDFIYGQFQYIQNHRETENWGKMWQEDKVMTHTN